MDEVVIVRSATIDDLHFASVIIKEIASSAKARGTGISNRTEAYIHEKMRGGKAVIAITPEGGWVGFIYMDIWDNGNYISHCGLIVAPPFRRMGIATRLKEKIFECSRTRFPTQKYLVSLPHWLLCASTPNWACSQLPFLKLCRTPGSGINVKVVCIMLIYAKPGSVTASARP